MGLLDGILGNVMDGVMRGSTGGGTGSPGMPGMPGMPGQGQNPLLMMVLQMLQQNGGIEGILARMQQAGYGQQAQSWVGTGQNMPIDASVLSQIFGRDKMGQLAQQAGLSHDDAEQGLSQMLPHVVDRMTPQGAMPDNQSDLVTEALAILQQQRGR